MRWLSGPLLWAATLGACQAGTATDPEGAPQGIRFQSSGAVSGAYSAQGNPADDPARILSSQFAIAMPDSVGGVVIIGYQPTDAAKGDVFILQAPRQTQTFPCAGVESSGPCHGRMFVGVTGTDLARVERAFFITEGSLTLTQIGPDRLKGFFTATLKSQEGTSTVQVTNGTIDVRYTSAELSNGGILCLISLAGAGQGTC
jgi:hypothetical protein